MKIRPEVFTFTVAIKRAYLRSVYATLGSVTLLAALAAKSIAAATVIESGQVVRSTSSSDVSVEFAEPDLYWRHLDSHVLRPQANRAGRIKHVWVKRNQKWPDHLHDCEIMQLAMVMLWNDLVTSSESIAT